MRRIWGPRIEGDHQAGKGHRQIGRVDTEETDELGTLEIIRALKTVS